MNNISYIFSSLEGVRRSLRNKFIYLFLDYDGTLSPIAQTPANAGIPDRTKDLLVKLSKIPDCKIAIISGRALNDISKRVDLKNVIYVGNHGFEIKGPKIKFKSPISRRYRRTLKEIKAKLEKNLSSFKGVFIEDKEFCLIVHYRLADKKDIPSIEAEFYASIFLYELRNNIQIRIGKMALEVRPPISWDKGKVVLWLLGRRLFTMRDKGMKVLPIYIGDDTTDEDAFQALKDKGLTIFVGKPKHTKARFYLKDTDEVAAFLTEVLKILDKGTA